MLVFAFVITKASQLLMAMDASLPQGKLAGFLAPLMRGNGDQLMMWVAILLGVCAMLMTPYAIFQPWPVLIVWIASIVMLLLATTSRERMRGFLARAAESMRESRWELLLLLALTTLAFLLRGIALEARWDW